jgi:hypothetical protein
VCFFFAADDKTERGYVLFLMAGLIGELWTRRSFSARALRVDSLHPEDAV